MDVERHEAKPYHPAFEKIKKLVWEFCNKHGQDCNFGDKLPMLLKDSGFKSIKQIWEPLNTMETDIKLLQKFLIQEVVLYRAFMPESLTDTEFEDIRQFVDELPASKIFVNYGVTMVFAQK